MAISYSKPTWTNGSGTAISAANLQALSDATKIMADACDSGASATATKIWNDKNDGNAGQPPAPKPVYAATGVAAWYKTTDTLPDGGKYATISFKSGHIYDAIAGVPGGTNMNTFFGTTGIDSVVYWRSE